MKIIIHRGSKEIGGSCVEIITEISRIIIDIGIPIVNSKGNKFNIAKYDSLSVKELVSEKVLPNIKGIYKDDIDYKKVDGIFISHPHIDHYGFFNYLREDVMYYIGESAKDIIDMTVIFTPLKGSIKNYLPLKSGVPLIVGDLKVTPYLMDHSAYDSYAFLIENGGRKIVYSGDFRNHGRKEKAFNFFLNNCPKNIDAIILEGTNFGRKNERIKSEREIEIDIDKLVKDHQGITLINQSSQNIDRLVSMYKVAKRNNKILVIDFYTANLLSKLSETIPHPSSKFHNIKVFYPRYLSNRIAKEGRKDLMYKFKNYRISRSEINENRDNIMMLMRNSMISDFNNIDIKNALFIYSMWEGYLKEDSMKKMLKFIKSNNMKFHNIHTSGHASMNTLEKMIDVINPKAIIPIHTFYPNQYFKLGKKIIILNDGESLEI